MEGRPRKREYFARRQGGKRYVTGPVSHKGVGVGGEEAEDLSQEAMSNSSGSVGNLGRVLQPPAPPGVSQSYQKS